VSDNCDCPWQPLPGQHFALDMAAPVHLLEGMSQTEISVHVLVAIPLGQRNGGLSGSRLFRSAKLTFTARSQAETCSPKALPDKAN
jgi:hypothetical protein